MAGAALRAATQALSVITRAWVCGDTYASAVVGTRGRLVVPTARIHLTGEPHGRKTLNPLIEKKVRVSTEA